MSTQDPHRATPGGKPRGPVAITNTHAVGVAHAGIVAWMVKHHPEVTEAWLLPVAAETWDGYLNDINGHHVTEPSVVAALEAARSGPVEEGSVGGGTGMNCYQFKGGSGTASRIVGDYAVGVFLQANFGARQELVLAGVPLGDALADDNPMQEFRSAPPGSPSTPRAASPRPGPARPARRAAARTGRGGSGSRCRAGSSRPSPARAPAAAARPGTAPACRRTR